MKILIAEDDPSLRRALTAVLTREHYKVEAVSNGKDALEYLSAGGYDAAVLDVMMPYLDGFAVVKELRQRKSFVPVLFLTARDQTDDKVAGLDAGADDYLTKPFDIKELLARIRVLTRKSDIQTGALINTGNTSLDTALFTLSAPGGTCVLANKEYQCMLHLMRNRGSVLTADSFMENVWDPEGNAFENSLWTVIYNLRKRLLSIGSDLKIVTRRNQGYVLEIENEK